MLVLAEDQPHRCLGLSLSSSSCIAGFLLGTDD